MLNSCWVAPWDSSNINFGIEINRVAIFSVLLITIRIPDLLGGTALMSLIDRAVLVTPRLAAPRAHQPTTHLELVLGRTRRILLPRGTLGQRTPVSLSGSPHSLDNRCDCLGDRERYPSRRNGDPHPERFPRLFPVSRQAWAAGFQACTVAGNE